MSVFIQIAMVLSTFNIKKATEAGRVITPEVEPTTGTISVPRLFSHIWNSVVDNTTRFTNLKFMIGFHDGGQADYRRVDLTFTVPRAGAVTPMCICTQNLFTTYGESVPAFAGGFGDGYVTGFVAGLAEDRGSNEDAADIASIQKFTVAASQETCNPVLGEPTQ
ncbi:hypothetical protein BU15DRAFT_75906 [Melanogaster broomeanus]|nr:hypothetical protein BU15DRAFT_75906 [Melanogaster broomeanus]